MNGHDLGKLEGMCEEQRKHLDFRFDELEKKVGECKEINKEQDARINKLERWKWFNRAIAGTGGIVGGFIAAILGPFK